jgi:DNA-binding transcriptional MerR regulator
MNELENLRGREFRGVEELAAAASKIIEQYTNEPARGNVRLGITERIVRHYMSEGLLGTPTGNSGAIILFNYGNLLRLLTVKKLLADGWSIIKIREFIASLDTGALEHLVTTTLTSLTSSEKRSEARKENESATGFRVTGRPPPNASAPASPQMSLASAPPPLTSLPIQSAKRTERASAAEWIELATGLEIKIRRSFRPPRDEQERERLAARFWSVVNGTARGE